MLSEVVSHGITCFVQLLIGSLIAMFIYYMGVYGKSDPEFVKTLKWVDEGYMVLVFTIFAVRTIIILGRGTLDITSRCLLA